VLAVRFADDAELVVSERVTRKIGARPPLLPAAVLEERIRAGSAPSPLDPVIRWRRARGPRLARGGQLHTVLRDQRALVGIGRALRQRDPARSAAGAVRDRPTGSRRRSVSGLLAAIKTTLTDGHRALPARAGRA